MNYELERFLKKINFTDYLDYFKEAKVDKVILNKKEETLKVFIEAPEVIDIEIIDKLINICQNGFDNIKKINISIKYEQITDENILNAFKYLFANVIKRRPSLQDVLNNEIKIENNKLTLTVSSKVEEINLKEEVLSLIKDLKKYGYNDINVDIKLDVKLQEDNKKEIKNKKEKEIEETKESPLIYGNKCKLVPSSIENIIGEIKNAAVDAFVFGTEYLEKEKICVITLKISDNTDSLLAKIKFFKKDMHLYPKVKKSIKEGNWYRFFGNVENDEYAHDLVLDIKSVEKIEHSEDEIVDDAENKRVELHAHTMMSQMDGVINVKDLIAQAKKFGHKAVAITDHNSLQAFPDAYNCKFKDGIKIIYGAELSVINDEVDIVINKKNYNFLKEEFVVFDIETTGFNANSDSIIEIGAVKIKNGEILDKFDELINPNRPIPKKITELTQIDDDLIKDCDNEENVVKRFLEWAKDDPMVAHNAKFDTSFIVRACNQYNIKTFDTTVCDTMEISRILNPELSRHSLSALTKRYAIEFNEDEHHRGDYDALATAKAFYKMCLILYDRNIEDIDALYEDIDPANLIKFARTFHITLLVKNATGLKNLFKIISLANTKYLFKEPKVPKSVVEKHREGLLIGSGCVNGEIFNVAKTKEESELANKMNFYDFIEVNPPSISEYLIETSNMGSMLEIQNNIRKIINTAIAAGKIVCATGDVHNLKKEDLIYRKIITYQKVPGLGFHPLYRDHVKNIPNMYFMTTKEMKQEFSFLEDEKLIEDIVVNNTNKIADMVEEVQIIKDKLYTPKMENSDKITKDMVYERAHEMYGDPLPDIVKDRIEAELNGIISNGYSVLYLIAEKLVKKSNDDGYFVGSRGSVGSSFVATMMGITEVNGLPAHYLCPKCKKSIWEENGVKFSLNYASGYDLPDKMCPDCNIKMRKEGQDIPFATFLGFKAEKVPDIDLNFSGENQADAHNYTKVLFGEHNVYRAGTISTVAEKTAFGFVKGYFENYNIIKRNVEIERLAKGVTGVKRTTGQHPGGIIVIPDYMDVFDFTAYQYPADDTEATWYTTHFDFHAIHDNILKLDILGHDDPTMLKYLGDTTGIDIMTIPFDDKGVLSLFSSPDALGVKQSDINCTSGTLGIPEFGTNFVIKMLDETKPKTFAELVKISGLSHGTDVWNGNARDLILQNICPFKDIIGCRDDILVTLMNYNMEPSLSFKISEFVRKGRASKEPEQWAIYEEEMRKFNIPEWFIGSCKKIKYMFPKAHATAYVMMGFRVAWFKLYRPINYYSNFFGIRCFDFDIESMLKGSSGIRAKISEILAKGYDVTNKEKNTLDVLNVALEMTLRGFSFKNIDLEKSDSRFFVIDEDQKSLYFPFRALDGLGDNVATKIIEEREDHPFISIEDFQNRCKVNNTTIDKLKTLGVLDGLNESNQLSLF